MLGDYRGRFLNHSLGATLFGYPVGANYGGNFDEEANYSIYDKFFNPQEVIGSGDRGYIESGPSSGFGLSFGWIYGQGRTRLLEF